MRTLAILAVAACTSSPPLAKLHPQVEIQADPATNPRLSIAMTTWNDLDVLHDAITAGEISATLDGAPLAIDPNHTGTYGTGDSYMATFALPEVAARTAGPATSTIAISDGETTWSAAIPNLLMNDLAPTAPLVAGTNVFEWPSAASQAPYSTIAWACLEVAGASAACDGEQVHDPAISISQQYITATIAAAPGARIELTGERQVDVASSGNGPMFSAQIYARYSGSL
jgi:hypothetical protein